jgi:hypothetical protein
MSPVRSTSCGGERGEPFHEGQKMGWGCLREKNGGPRQCTNRVANARISFHLGKKRGEDAFSLVDNALGVGVETDDGCRGVDAPRRSWRLAAERWEH